MRDKTLKSLLFIFLITASLYGQSTDNEQEEQMVIRSGEAEYNGQEINLIGQVVVQHSLGKIVAHRLTILPSTQADKKNRFCFLKMNEDVLIELQGGGQLECQQAEVDYSSMRGTFLGTAEKPDVIYRNQGEPDSGSEGFARAPLIVKSDEMQIGLIRQALPEEKAIKTRVKDILAHRHVRVHYNQDYLLLADKAFYQRLPSDKAALAGTVTLTAQEEHPYCMLTNANGDRIQAKTIQLNTLKRELHLDQPKGRLIVQQSNNKPQQALQFSSDEIIWNDHDLLLTLKGNVSVAQGEKVRIETDYTASIQQANVNGKKIIRSITSSQDTILIYQDEKRQLSHKIICPGRLFIDHEQFVTTLKSSKDRLPANQVYFEDLLGEMYADDVQLNYILKEQELVPTKIVLRGQVKILNRFDGHFQESGSVLQYALADQVEYFPSKQEIILSANKGNRVLLFDKVNNMQMSAPALKVKRDDKSEKSSIQGIGEVRFTFIEKELEQLKQHFSLEEDVKQNKENP